MILHCLLLIISALTAATLVFFFVIGVGDGSVSDFNILLWTTLLGVAAAVMIAGYALGKRGHRAWANLILLILAVPGLGMALFLAMVVLIPGRWN